MHCSDEVRTVLPVLVEVYLSFALLLVFVENYGLIGLFSSLGIYPAGTQRLLRLGLPAIAFREDGGQIAIKFA